MVLDFVDRTEAWIKRDIRDCENVNLFAIMEK
jgi:hypothetical protein